jgi:hypothetical protein
MSFPLYDTLSHAPNTHTFEDRQLARKIMSLDADGQEKIYLLIRHHHCTNRLKLERTGSNCTFDVSTFDSVLKQILWQFCVLHLKVMKDEKKRK